MPTPERGRKDVVAGAGMPTPLVYAEVFPADPPARMTMQVGLAPGYLLSVACVAVAE